MPYGWLLGLIACAILRDTTLVTTCSGQIESSKILKPNDAKRINRVNMANVLDVAEKFIRLGNEEEGISNLKLQKLVYYAQGYYLALYGVPLFEDDIEAWVHGPVVPSLYHEFKEYGSDSIENLKGFNEHTCLTKQEIGHIEEIYDVFGQFSAWKLRDMTHEESPWIKNESCGGVISKRELKKYFETRID